MKKIHQQEIDLPFEIGQTYITKMQTGEKFTVTQIIMKKEKGKTDEIYQLMGIYERYPHLGECPLAVDRLIPRKEFTGVEFEISVCPKCKHEFKD